MYYENNKYKEALERARNYYSTTDSVADAELIELIFPELKEIEDEKNIKNLIDELKCSLRAANCQNEACNGGHEKRIALLEWAIAWLEKQGEKPQGKTVLEAINEEKVDNANKVKPKFKIGDTIINIHYRWDGKHRIREITDDKYIFDSGSYIDIKEQDSWELADKVEPKFKVGDWVVRGDTIAQILDIQEQYYVGLDINGKDFTSSRFLNDAKIHLWTIQDAKDGDVLQLGGVTAIFREYIGNGSCKCYCSVCNGEFEIPSKDNSYGCYNATPATKEQRDLLFAKMKEAGYEWNAEEKELNKIEQRPTQILEPFEAEHGKYYYCIKDYFCSGKKQASKGDVIQALRGMSIMGLKDASEYFLPVNSIKCNSTCSEDETSIAIKNPKAYKIGFADGEAHAKEEKQSSWSKEDKEMIDNIIDYMQPMPIFFESTKGKSGKEYTKEFVKDATKFLKSLKNGRINYDTI